MSSQYRFPLFFHSDSIYGRHNEVLFPRVIVEKLRQTTKARLLMNVKTGAEAWFPESVFLYHFHIGRPDEALTIFLSIPEWLAAKKQEFFKNEK